MKSWLANPWIVIRAQLHQQMHTTRDHQLCAQSDRIEIPLVLQPAECGSLLLLLPV